MKKIFLVLGSVLIGAISSYSQNSNKTTEIGIFLGGSFYLGDLNPNGFFKFTQPAYGLIYRYNINNRFSARANVLIGEVTAYDNQSSSAYQQDRNLNFKSPVYELSGQMEFNFQEYSIDNPKYNFTPFIFGGLGIFKFEPYGLIGDQWVALQPLHTEGQGTKANPNAPYTLIQPCIPFGIGIKTSFSQTICLPLNGACAKPSPDILMT